MPEKTPVTLETPAISEERLETLRTLVPEAFSEGKIDFEKLRLVLGGAVDENSERYSFNWSGKRDAIRILSMPSRATLIPVKDESVNFDTTENLFIEGDNLEVLKLLYKPYFGKVKMIYIDPPYNTGRDFIYPDNYSDPLGAYLESTRQKDEEGNLLTSNPESSGRYHSAWLSMMYPRLFMARQLLSNEGIIFVSIDDHEVNNLVLLMNEIFGEENYRNMIIIRRGVKSVQAQFDTIDRLNYGGEYILAYSKNSEFRFPQFYVESEDSKPGGWNNHWRGTDRPKMRYELFGQTPETGQWRWKKKRSIEAIENYAEMLKELGKSLDDEVTIEEIDKWFIERQKEGEEPELLRLSRNGTPEHYVPPSEDFLPSSLWLDMKPNGSQKLKKLFGRKVFDNPKSPDLIYRLAKFCDAGEGDIILDFFAGSGSTAQAILELNREDQKRRKFILVQLPEPISDKEFTNLSDLCTSRIKKVIASKESGNGGNTSNLFVSEGFKSFKLTESNFKQWKGSDSNNPDDYASTMGLHSETLFDSFVSENVIYEIAIKEGFSLNCTIEEVTGLDKVTVYKVSDAEKEQSFYITLDEEFALASLSPLGLNKDSLFICRDSALNDQTAANLALQCRLKTL